MPRDLEASSSERQEIVTNKILDELKQYNYKVDRAFGAGLGTVSVDLIARKHCEKLAGSQSAEIRDSLRSDILGIISGPSGTPEDSGSTEPRSVEVSPSRKQSLMKKLLQNLSYPDMLFREESVVRASETTFRWIFEREQQPDRPWASFCQWLEASDQQLYWITGKPGSGKSTLMKFISQPSAIDPDNELEDSCNEARCLSFLKNWAGNDPLIVASYYFWAIGSPMQRSKEGMLRTLLHGLLSQATPEAIATIMPKSWEALYLFGEDPLRCTEESLQKLLSRTFRYLCPTTRICLFIDGLDEFEGEHENLILYLRDSLKAHPIKICVSSRQWQMFEDAFHNTPQLRLQDLTLSDMMEYVRSELYVGAAFAQLRERDPIFSDELNKDVALRSNGVFLWLTLVVKSLRKGITAGDRISDLKARLDELPQDLEALFERILGDLDPEYLGQAIQYFQLMEACREIELPNVMVFSYADEEDDMFGVNCPRLELDWKTYKSRVDHLKRRLNSRCMGLLEITEPKGLSLELDEILLNYCARTGVNYLHRTFGDYIARVEVRERLSRRAGPGFEQRYDSHLRLCSSELAFLKSIALARQVVPAEAGPYLTEDAEETVRFSLFRCLKHATLVQKHSVQSMIRLIGVLEIIYPEIPNPWPPPRGGLISEWKDVGLEFSFISDVIAFGLVEYIRAKSHRHNPTIILKLWRKVSKARRAHMEISRCRNIWSALEEQLAIAALSEPRDPAITELLLERGADPQQKGRREGPSIWTCALLAYMETWFRDSGLREEREQIVLSMVKHGASIEMKVIKRAYQALVSWSTLESYAARFGIAESDDTFYSSIRDRLKLFKQGLR